MFVIGLTGSIGMGKTTTAQFFRDAGVPVFDADAAVHDLYAGEAVAPIEAAFPGTTEAGRVDRGRLSERLRAAPGGFARLEAIVHPLVEARRARFLEAAAAAGAARVVLDIPLLFEGGGVDVVDHVVLVSAPAAVQRARVLARPGMTEEKFAMIAARQMPDVEKRARADTIIETGEGLDLAREMVAQVLRLTQNRVGRRRVGETDIDA